MFTETPSVDRVFEGGKEGLFSLSFWRLTGQTSPASSVVFTFLLFAVKIHKCSVDEEPSPDLPSESGGTQNDGILLFFLSVWFELVFDDIKMG